MEQQTKQQPALTRLILCVVAAAALYAALDKFGEQIPQLSPHLPWLAAHKVQAIALTAAALFGGSLLLFPPGGEPAMPPPPEDADCGPYDGYEPACGPEESF